MKNLEQRMTESLLDRFENEISEENACLYLESVFGQSTERERSNAYTNYSQTFVELF